MKQRARHIIESTLLVIALSWGAWMAAGAAPAAADGSAGGRYCYENPEDCELYDGTPCGGPCDTDYVCCQPDSD